MHVIGNYTVRQSAHYLNVYRVYDGEHVVRSFCGDTAENEACEYARNPPRTISSGHFSVDIQALDALDYLRAHHPAAYTQVIKDFPETADPTWEGAWLDTEAMGVDVEYGSWLVDAIEATGLVAWEDGEPWTT